MYLEFYITFYWSKTREKYQLNIKLFKKINKICKKNSLVLVQNIISVD